jgi:hypothetical protein
MECAQTNRLEIETVLKHYSDERADVASVLVTSMIGQCTQTSTGVDSIEQLYRTLPLISITGKTWTLKGEFLERGKLFASMPLKTEYDLEHIKAAYLITNIDDAWQMYRTHKWNEQLSINDFCELILPYRIGNERITDWRKAYRTTYSNLTDTLNKTTSSIQAARIIAECIGAVPYNMQLTTPHRSAIDLLEAPMGYCRDDCDRTVFAMRAFGVPVTVDMMLVSPENGSSHQWTVAYDNIDRRFRMFDNKRFLPTRDSIYNDQRCKGKVYRQTFAMQHHSKDDPMVADNSTTFRINPHLKDVTAEYFGHNKATVEVNTPTNSEVYLGLYTISGFRPVDIASHSGNKVTFNDIEPNVIFFPIVNTNGSYTPCGNPFLLNSDGKVHQFTPQVKEMHTIRLTRKMPLRFTQKEALATLIGTKLQSAKTENGPWHDLYTFHKAPITSYHSITFNNAVDDRYVRIFPTTSRTPQVADIYVYADIQRNNALPMTTLGSESQRARMKMIIDDDILSWRSCDDSINGIKLHIESPAPIRAITLCPHTDDNFVVPGQEYELLYFNSTKWVSLGKKTATDVAITFTAPENAVFLLHNRTKGREVQVFVYQNGKQKFSIDRPN